MTPAEQSTACDSCIKELASLKALLDLVDEVCFILDQDFRITYVNNHTIASFEKSLDELIGHRFHEIFPYTKAILGLNSIRQQLFNGQKVITEVQSPLSGRSFQVKATGFDDNFLFFMRETTVERRYHQLLLEKDAKFLAITDAMSDVILIVEPSGTISYASEAALQITGFSADEFEDEKFFEFIAPKHLESAKNNFNALIQSPDDDALRVFKIKHKEGGQLEFHAVKQNSEHSRIDGIILKYHP